MKTTLAAALAACALSACAPVDQPVDPTVGQSGISLRSDILADTDVAGMGYRITPVDCDTGDVAGEPVDAQRDLEDLLLPGGHPGFENQPFDAASGHLFADHFQALEPGCYDVTVQPITAEGGASEHCSPASAEAVEVIAEQVTEIMLISQCVGDTIGALDIIAAINHAPEIIDITYAPSKFTCGEQATICVTSRDPDGDPTVLLAEAEDGVELALQPAERGEDGTTTQCVQVNTPAPGEYAVSLSVFDQMFGPGGRLVTVESLLDEGLTSRASITAPVHAMAADACLCACPEGFALNAAGDACERQVEVDAVFNGAEVAVCEGDDRNEYGALGAVFPGGLIIQNDFFGNDFETPEGRLNDIGIWACEDGIEDEWIGFSFCLVVEEAGEYVIGTGGDDHTRITLDGNVLFHNSGQNSFRHWWMIPVYLEAGTYVFELEGYDTGVAATLGADIYGPFPEGSTADDDTLAGLDFEGSVIWTTGDQVGGVFQTGDTSGYSCPDGTSLNLCGDVATCTGNQVAECQ